MPYFWNNRLQGSRELSPQAQEKGGIQTMTKKKKRFYIKQRSNQAFNILPFFRIYDKNLPDSSHGLYILSSLQ